MSVHSVMYSLGSAIAASGCGTCLCQCIVDLCGFVPVCSEMIQQYSVCSAIMQGVCVYVCVCVCEYMDDLCDFLLGAMTVHSVN